MKVVFSFDFTDNSNGCSNNNASGSGISVLQDHYSEDGTTGNEGDDSSSDGDNGIYVGGIVGGDVNDKMEINLEMDSLHKALQPLCF